MTERSIVVMTARFPYGPSEFLEGEIDLLCRSFDHVRIVPARISGELAAVPVNAEIDLGLVRRRHAGAGHGRYLQRQTRRVAHALRSLADSRFRQELDSGDGPLSWRWIRAVTVAQSHYADVLEWARSVDAPDLAYCFWLDSSARALRTAWPETAIVTRAHGGDIDHRQLGLGAIPFLQDNLLSTNRVFSVSEWGRKALTTACPASTDRIRVAALGSLDVGGLAPRSTDGVLRVLSVSSVDRNKRVHLIAEAMAHVARSGRKVHWRHIGDGPELGLVRSTVDQSNPLLHAQLNGAESHPSVLRSLRAGPWDVFLNVSLLEGAPVSIMEAQSAGIPCVATRVCGTPEVVDEDLDCLISPLASSAEIGAAVLKAAGSPREWAIARRERWHHQFDRSVRALEFVQEISSLA